MATGVLVQAGAVAIFDGGVLTGDPDAPSPLTFNERPRGGGDDIDVGDVGDGSPDPPLIPDLQDPPGDDPPPDDPFFCCCEDDDPGPPVPGCLDLPLPPQCPGDRAEVTLSASGSYVNPGVPNSQCIGGGIPTWTGTSTPIVFRYAGSSECDQWPLFAPTWSINYFGVCTDENQITVSISCLCTTELGPENKLCFRSGGVTCYEIPEIKPVPLSDDLWAALQAQVQNGRPTVWLLEYACYRMVYQYDELSDGTPVCRSDGSWVWRGFRTYGEDNYFDPSGSYSMFFQPHVPGTSFPSTSAADSLGTSGTASLSLFYA